MQQTSKSVPILTGVTVLLVVLVIALLVVLYKARTEMPPAYNVSDSTTSQALNPDSDFSDFSLEEIDPDSNLTEEEQIEYTIDSIDKVIADLESATFDDLGDLDW